MVKSRRGPLQKGLDDFDVPDELDRLVKELDKIAPEYPRSHAKPKNLPSKKMELPKKGAVLSLRNSSNPVPVIQRDGRLMTGTYYADSNWWIVEVKRGIYGATKIDLTGQKFTGQTQVEITSNEKEIRLTGKLVGPEVAVRKRRRKNQLTSGEIIPPGKEGHDIV